MLVDELLRECDRMLVVDTDLGPIDGRRDAVSIIMWSYVEDAETGVGNGLRPAGLAERRSRVGTGGR